RIVSEIELPRSTDEQLKEMQQHLEGYIERVPRSVPNGDDLFVNEEGWIEKFSYGFILSTFRHVLVGNGLIINHDDEEIENASPNTSLKWVKENISFVNLSSNDN